MENLHRLKNIKINKNEGTQRLMIGNVPELQEVTLKEIYHTSWPGMQLNLQRYNVKVLLSSQRAFLYLLHEHFIP
jgi:hypothetical protein